MPSKPLLRTHRTILRLPEPGDVNAIVTFYRDNADHLQAGSPIKPPSFYTPEHWAARVRDAHEEFQKDRACNLFIFTAGREDEILGFANFTVFVRGGFHACYLGYGLARSAQGQGLMTEALREAVRYVFEDLNIHRIMANHTPENVRSDAVLRRLGFVREGYAKEYLRLGGRWRDHVLTSLTNPAWRPPT